MDGWILVIFGFVYLGMLLGEIPGLRLDRAGVALLGAIALLATERVSPEEAWRAVDVPTIGLLLGLMIISAQFRLGGFYTFLTRRIAGVDLGPAGLLGLVMVTAAVLSAVLANDIVCLAMTPVLIQGCWRRGLDPVPHLLGLACASNIGSAATLIGNPQNILIGAKLKLSFGGYLAEAAVPTAAGLVAAWVIIVGLFRGRWKLPGPGPEVEEWRVGATEFNLYQSAKGVGVVLVLMGIFLFTDWPREVVALTAGGVLLTSRRMASRQMLGEVDWQLLVLFIGLFVVNHAMETSGALGAMFEWVRGWGVKVEQPAVLFVATVVLSNLVSNVPAVMLLLPTVTGADGGPVYPAAGTILALSSTLAGNLLIVGSIANIIVVEGAAGMGLRITWKDHARVGVPVTVVTLGIAGLWLWLRG